MYLFVYGTLKQKEDNHWLIETSKFLGNGKLKGYKLIKKEFFSIEKDKNSFVLGEVYQINDKTLKDVDKFEEVGFLYNRELKEIEINNSILNCYTYTKKEENAN